MCGILAFFAKNNDYIITKEKFYDLLYNLRNRGQDNMDINFLPHTNNCVYLGHTKYTTSGAKDNGINMPYLSKNKLGEYLLIFNGNIPLIDDKYNNDTEMIIDYFNNVVANNFEEILQQFIKKYERSYSMIIQHQDTLYIMRDRFGVRPLYYYEDSNYFLFSSETNILPTFKKINSGSIYKINNNKLEMLYFNPNLLENHCLFEYIYFMNKESEFEKTNVQEYRKQAGRLLADNDKYDFENKENYIVCGVPKTGNDYALTYAEQIGIKYNNYIMKNSNVNRTFILKNNEERNKYAKVKYLFSPHIKNKNIILVDDSIVRGITLKNLVKNLKEYGVKEIHVRIASPPVNNVCNYGIDIPTKKELIYDEHINLKNYFECDSLKYLPLHQVLSLFDDCDHKCYQCLSKDVNLEW